MVCGALVASCGASEDGGFAAAGGGGGAGGAGGGATSASSSSGVGGSGGGGGGEMDCAELAECGDFGKGCVGCAVATICADAFNGCTNDPDCTQFGSCVQMCDPKNLDCSHTCEAQFPGASEGYYAMVACVMCDVCRTSCMPPEGVCM